MDFNRCPNGRQPIPLHDRIPREILVERFGKPARLRIPPLTQNGQVFRLKGFGMPAVGKADDKGDLYGRVDVQLPTQLSPEERAHYEALAKLSGGAANTHSAA